MKTEIALTVDFTKGGNASDFQLYGWSGEEPNHTWTEGHSSALLLPKPDTSLGLFIELVAFPHAHQDLPRQRVFVTANGRQIGATTFSTWMQVAWYLPALPQKDRGITLIFDLPDAAAPPQKPAGRVLGLAGISLRVLPLLQLLPPVGPRVVASQVAEDETTAIATAERMTGMSARELMMKFDSLGDNCELGFVQRRCGAEPLGLFRFSSGHLWQVVRGIENEFDGLANELNVQVEGTTYPEWMVHERNYDIRYHTWIPGDQITEQEIRAQELKRLKFLRRKLLEDISEAGKIFVVKRVGRPITLEELLPLHIRLNRHAANWLLCVQPADENHPAGLVEEVFPQIMRGYVDRFIRPGIARDESVPAWLAVLANAYLLHQQATT
jgi:hypothetical protein